jgi:simple sugar transport system ATP-binding protein
MTSAVEMKGITKTFPGVVANDNVDFILDKGEVHGLLGENGAGKTVLMSVLYGLYRPDKGQIFVNGGLVEIDKPSTAMKLGIGMVHQHFMLVPSLTVAENIVLGCEPSKHNFWFDTNKAISDTKALSTRYGLQVDPKAVVKSLPVGIQQRVEILKALYRKAEILILDEPTSVLTPQETERLFSAIKTLRDQGKSVIFISHKLKEVCTICDRITVLRKGRVVGTVDVDQTSPKQLAKMMVGRELPSTYKRKKSASITPVLRVEELRALNDRKLLTLKDIAFEVHESEILGLAGVEGNGQTELIEVLTGIRKPEAGKILLNGERIDNLSTHKRMERGLSDVPQDRQRTGLILGFSVSENLILGRHDRQPFAAKWLRLDLKTISDFAEERIREYSIKTPSKDTLAGNLSGGTQQRVVVARECSGEPKFIIAAQPTRGLDVGATDYVRRKLLEMRDRGCAILLISTDLDEILALSDRIAVIYEGQIVAFREHNKTNEIELGLLMAGGKND